MYIGIFLIEKEKNFVQLILKILH